MCAVREAQGLARLKQWQTKRELRNVVNYNVRWLRDASSHILEKLGDAQAQVAAAAAVIEGCQDIDDYNDQACQDIDGYEDPEVVRDYRAPHEGHCPNMRIAGAER